MSNGHAIPDEVFEDILETLSARDILAFAASCRRMKDLVDKSLRLLLILELATYGYRLSRNWRDRTSNRSLQELLLSFRRSVKRWETFDYTYTLRIDKQREHSTVVGTILVKEFDDTLQFYDLRSTKGPPGNIGPCISHQTLPGYRKFHWDASQDLLAVYYHELGQVQLRRFTEDGPHPLVEVPLLETGQLNPSPSCMTILGHRLILLASDQTSSELVVRDWRTGDLLLRTINFLGGNVATLTNDLIMVLLRDASNSEISLGVFNLSSGTWRLHLRLPFATLPSTAYLTVEPVSGSKDEETLAYYSRDLSAERISLSNFFFSGITYYVVVSHHQILYLVPSPTEECKTLNWAEWGPASTRWFHSPNSVFRSVTTLGIYFCNQIQKFIENNKICSTHYDAADILFCDFNPRIIRRSRSSSLPSGSGNGNGNGNGNNIEERVDTKEISNNLAQFVVTDEWVLRSSKFTEDVRSRLPFRAFIRKKFEEWSQNPHIVTNLMAVFTGLGHLDVYYFDDRDDDNDLQREK